jgi:hypothetical protein
MNNLEAENARLKAECQARQAENSVLAVECDSLKSEVERLTKAGASLSKEVMVVMLNGGAHEELIKAHDDWKDLTDGKPKWGKTCTK